MSSCVIYLYSQHVECECTLVSWSIDLQNKVDQGEIVDRNHVLLISLHGNQSEHAQQVQDGGTKLPQFRWMKLCIAHV